MVILTTIIVKGQIFFIIDNYLNKLDLIYNYFIDSQVTKHDHVLYSPAGKFLVEKSEFSTVNTGNIIHYCIFISFIYLYLGNIIIFGIIFLSITFFL